MAEIFGTQLPDILSGTSEDDSIFGLGGQDTLLGSRGNDTLNGGGPTPFPRNEIDTVDYSNLGGPITLLPTGVVDKGRFGTDQLISIETIIAPLNQANWIDAATADRKTSINVNLARQSLQVRDIPGLPAGLNLTVKNFQNVRGTSNDDSLIGDAQNNTFEGLGGNDFINGDRGFDTVDYSDEKAPITLLPRGIITGKTAGTDRLSQIESIVAPLNQKNLIDASAVTSDTALGVDLGASISVDLKANTLIVDLSGDRTLKFNVQNFVNVTGTNNTDSIAGDHLANTLNGSGGSDKIAGRGGNDVLTGSSGNDALSGNGGNDVLTGTDTTARGRFELDTLNGGTGFDRFILGDRSGSYYKDPFIIDPLPDPIPVPFPEPLEQDATIRPILFNSSATIQGFSNGDTITLGAGETYKVVNDKQGFDIFATSLGRLDLIADVRSKLDVSGLGTEFQLASGEKLGFLVGA